MVDKFKVAWVSGFYLDDGRATMEVYPPCFVCFLAVSFEGADFFICIHGYLFLQNKMNKQSKISKRQEMEGKTKELKLPHDSLQTLLCNNFFHLDYSNHQI